MASQGGHTTTVDVLLRQGADPNIADNVRKLNWWLATMLQIYHYHIHYVSVYVSVYVVCTKLSM